MIVPQGQVRRPGFGRPRPAPRSAEPVRRTDFEAFDNDGREVWFEVLASASGPINSAGPMTRECRQFIARRGATYYVINDDDGYITFHRLRHYKSEAAGIAAAVARSTAFVLGHSGWPVAAWSDEEVEGLEFNDETWDPEDDDPDDPDTELKPPAEQEALWRTTIRDGAGIVLVGVGASSALPNPDPSYVFGCSDRDRQQLARVGIQAEPVSIELDDVVAAGVLVGALPEVLLVRLATELGDGRVWELTVDAVALIDCGREAYVARAVRDRP